MNRNKLYTGILIVAALAVGFMLGTNAPTSRVSEPESVGGIEESVHLLVEDAEGVLIARSNVTMPVESTVFDLLQHVTGEENIRFKYEDYGPDMGVFIKEIGAGVIPEGSWWQFWVNAEYAEVGASSYTLQSGDTIFFKLTNNYEE